MSGMIVPSDSLISQFEITSFPHGGRVVNEDLPVVVWASRIPGKKPCPNGKPVFDLVRETSEYKITARREGYTPCVCLCMGGFIE